MIDKSNLSDEIIPGILEAYFPYGREQGPVPPGIYRVRIAEIREVKPGSGFVTFEIDFRVVGEARLNDGRFTEEYDGFFIPRQWVTSAPRGDGRSAVLDLLRSAGIATQPRSNREIEEAIQQIQETRELLTVKVGWEGFSKELLVQELMDLTDHYSSYGTARFFATEEEIKQAQEFALRARRYRDFPDDPDGEGKLHRFTDPETGVEIDASPKIRRFLPSRDF